jgi:hypothetical protein
MARDPAERKAPKGAGGLVRLREVPEARTNAAPFTISPFHHFTDSLIQRQLAPGTPSP